MPNKLDTIKQEFEALVAKATAAGLKVSIENSPLMPLAMGNTEAKVSVWEKRKPTKAVRFRAPQLKLYRGSLSYTTLLKQLKQIKEFPIVERSICVNLDKLNDGRVLFGEMSKLFIGWPKHSGMIYHPVPNPRSKSKSSAKNIYEQTVNYWDGKYGDLRMELLDYMIQRVETKINEARIEQGFNPI